MDQLYGLQLITRATLAKEARRNQKIFLCVYAAHGDWKKDAAFKLCRTYCDAHRTLSPWPGSSSAAKRWSASDQEREERH